MIAINVVEDFMLRDITIHNYRCFKDFHIDGLAQVNLIVGMNNSGKTSLLEAIYLFLIHTWLAWQETPGMPMGQAITAQVLGYNSSIAIAKGSASLSHLLTG